MVTESPSAHPKEKEPSLVLSGKNAKRSLFNLKIIQAKASRSRKIKWSNWHGKTTANLSIDSSKPRLSQSCIMKRHLSCICIMVLIRLLFGHRPDSGQLYEWRPEPIKPCGQDHWDIRYKQNGDQSLSWTESAQSLSQQWIRETVPQSSSIADIGAGKSLLLPTLLRAGYHNLTHVEWSQSASEALQHQLVDQASKIAWFVGDLNQWQPTGFIDLWHDRAVFHFQMDHKSIQQYLHSLHRAVRPGGYALLATFHLDGPKTCSGLPVQRYDANSLISTLNDSEDGNWKEVKSQIWKHQTPSGSEQIFQYLLTQRP